MRKLFKLLIIITTKQTQTHTKTFNKEKLHSILKNLNFCRFSFFYFFSFKGGNSYESIGITGAKPIQWWYDWKWVIHILSDKGESSAKKKKSETDQTKTNRRWTTLISLRRKDDDYDSWETRWHHFKFGGTLPLHGTFIGFYVRLQYFLTVQCELWVVI